MSEQQVTELPKIPLEGLPAEWERLENYYQQLSDVEPMGYAKGSFAGKAIGYGNCAVILKDRLAARAVVGQGSDALRSLRELSERVVHEKDLSSVQGFPGQVMFINSADYPCKSDCVRCGLDAALAMKGNKTRG